MRHRNRIWIAGFASWALLLSGVTADWVGPPGALQAIRLSQLLDGRRVEAARVQDDVDRLTAEARRIEKSPAAMEREIRRSLGYAAPDELIFDFTAAERGKAEAGP